MSEVREHALRGFLVNPFGTTFQSVALEGDLLRLVRNRRVSSVTLEGVSAKPIVRKGLLGATLTIPMTGSDDIVVRGASFSGASRFAKQLESAWVAFNLSALEREGPSIDRLCKAIGALVHRPTRYPAACAAGPLLAEVRALDVSLLSKRPNRVRSRSAPLRRQQMAIIEARLDAMGLALPQALCTPSSICLPFQWVRVRGSRAFISGHVACNLDGTLARPLGKVGADVSPEQGYASARLVALAHLASLKRALGDLDRVTAWLRVFAMVNVAPGFNETPRVTNGFSDLILELYGPEVGAHARSSIGMMLPFDVPVNCEAEVEIDGLRQREF